jgi:F420-non-reducing hydrogenase iron-sulfur subunit
VSRFQYPPNVRIIRLPCTSRVNPMFILRALQRGADGVVVAGCHPGECHYSVGNLYARRKFAVLKDLLESLGVEEGRVTFAWLSSAEAERFVKIVNAALDKVRQLGPSNRLVKVS